MKKILLSFTYVFHPILIPLYALLAYFLLDGGLLSGVEKVILLVQLILVSILIPLCFYFLIRPFDFRKPHDESKRNLKIPLLFEALALYLLTRESAGLERTPLLYYFIFGAIISVLCAFLVQISKRNFSLHMAGMGALTVFVMGLSLHNQVNMIYSISFLFASMGMVASGLLVKSHCRSAELYWGLLVGAVSQIVLLRFWL